VAFLCFLFFLAFVGALAFGAIAATRRVSQSKAPRGKADEARALQSTTPCGKSNITPPDVWPMP
jgi:hypothetical protein